MELSNLDAVKGMARARKMIHDDAKQDAHIIKERVADREKTYRSLKSYAPAVTTGFESLAPSYGGSNSMNTMPTQVNESYVDDSEDKLFAAFNQKMQVRENAVQSQMPYTPVQGQPRQVNKNLPKEILESFSNNFIDQSALNTERPVLDRIGITTDNQQQSQINESQTSVANSSTKIDYELIKAIVENSVKKYINALGKKMLTEGKESDGDIKAIHLSGNKFKFIDGKGNIYESKLVKVGNVNDKK